MEANSCNYCRSGKSISITYSECVFVTLGIQNALHMRHTVICGLPHSTIFFPYNLINGMIFENKVLKQNVCFDFLYNFHLKHFSF